MPQVSHTLFSSTQMFNNHLRIRLRSPKKAAASRDEHQVVRSVPSKSAQKSQKWRDTLKNSPEYAEFCKLDSLRGKVYRANLSDAKKEVANANAKERMRQYRERAKNKQQCAPPPEQATARVTRKETELEEERKKKVAEQKKTQRARMTGQKKRRHLEKRRLKYKEKKSKIASNSSTHQSDKESISTAGDQVSTPGVSTPSGSLREDPRSKSAKRQALCRARRVLPQSPRKYASTIIDLIETATPRKRKAIDGGLKSRKKVMPENNTGTVFREMMMKLKKKRGKKDREFKRSMAKTFSVMKNYRLMRSCSRELGIRWNLLVKSCKHSRNVDDEKNTSSLPRETRTAVHNYYNTQSTTLPDKKAVSKKTMKQKQILHRPIVSLYKEFRALNPDTKVGPSTFHKLRPKHIVPARYTKYRGCLCEYYANVELKLKTLNSTAQRVQQKLSKLTKNAYDVAKVTMCPRGEGEMYNKPACIQRSCPACGVSKMDDLLAPLAHHEDVTDVSWYRWGTIAMSNKKGKEVNRKVLIEKRGTFAVMVEELKKEVAPLTHHLFKAAWQGYQFTSLRTKMPEGWVIQVLDFAENFTIVHKDEVSSAHWNHDQVTVHPTVCYYKCGHCNEATVTESLVFISDDVVHDHHSVHHFTMLANHHLKHTRALTITQQIQWSDGAASQYKSKGPFCDVSHALDDYAFPLERCFFGSRHGKGPSDGESAVVKRMASSAVANNQVVLKTAEDLATYCKENLTRDHLGDGSCCHSRRTIFVVHKEAIQRHRTEREVKTLEGTRAVHSIKCVKSQVVATRNLSCFCGACVSGSGDCANATYVEQYKVTQLKVVAKRKASGSKTANKRQQIDDPSSMEEEAPAEDGPTLAEDDPTLVEDGPTLAKDGPTLAEDDPTLVEYGPTLAEDGPTLAEDGTTLVEDGPTPAEDDPTPAEDDPTPADEDPTPSKDELHSSPQPLPEGPSLTHDSEVETPPCIL